MTADRCMVSRLWAFRYHINYSWIYELCQFVFDVECVSIRHTNSPINYCRSVWVAEERNMTALTQISHAFIDLHTGWFKQNIISSLAKRLSITVSMPHYNALNFTVYTRLSCLYTIKEYKGYLHDETTSLNQPTRRHGNWPKYLRDSITSKLLAKQFCITKKNNKYLVKTETAAKIGLSKFKWFSCWQTSTARILFYFYFYILSLR